MLICFVVVNTSMNLFGIYRGWLAVATYAVAVLCFVVALHFQRRWPAAALAGVLLVPFIVAMVVGASRR